MQTETKTCVEVLSPSDRCLKLPTPHGPIGCIKKVPCMPTFRMNPPSIGFVLQSKRFLVIRQKVFPRSRATCTVEVDLDFRTQDSKFSEE